ncbi:hypothetical protein NL43_06445 [Methanosphaera sp. WGK6]|nr:hypothetical protein NL43_06445 [Methanosphaera sp. WGK6]
MYSTKQSSSNSIFVDEQLKFYNFFEKLNKNSFSYTYFTIDRSFYYKKVIQTFYKGITLFKQEHVFCPEMFIEKLLKKWIYNKKFNFIK